MVCSFNIMHHMKTLKKLVKILADNTEEKKFQAIRSMSNETPSRETDLLTVYLPRKTLVDAVGV